MRTVRRRRAPAAVTAAGGYRTAAALAAATVLLSGCATSFGAQTNQPYQPAVGTVEKAGDIEVHNAIFIDNGDGTATLTAAIIDKVGTPDVLTEVSVTNDDGETGDLEPEFDVEIPAGGMYTLGGAGEIIAEDDLALIGTYVEALFSFENAGDVEVYTPVYSRSAQYDGVATEPVDDPDEAPGGVPETAPDEDIELDIDADDEAPSLNDPDPVD